MFQVLPLALRALALAIVLVVANLTAGLPSTHAEAAPASAGCGQTWQPGAEVRGALVYGGLQRTYLVHVPTGYTPTTPLPLVLNLHGSGMNADNEALLTHMSATADAHGFIVVYPNGTGSPTGWNIFPPNTDNSVTNNYAGIDDVGFLNALVDSLEGQMCIDTTRISATGFSLGAAMVYRLACADLPWLSAIAPVSGTMPQSSATCALAHPTPLIAFHGLQDAVVPYGGKDYSPPVPDVVAVWAGLNGCATSARTIMAQDDVTGLDYSACANGATQLYTVSDGGHTWPGGYQLAFLGTTTMAVDASAAIWSFVDQHPLAASGDGPGASVTPAATSTPAPASPNVTVVTLQAAAPAAHPRAKRAHRRLLRSLLAHHRKSHG